MLDILAKATLRIPLIAFAIIGLNSISLPTIFAIVIICLAYVMYESTT